MLMGTPTDNRRRSSRIRLQIPLFVRGIDDGGAEFIDLTKTLNISSTGACVINHLHLHPGQILRITIPVSSESVSGLIPAETPPIQARVRRLCEAGETRLVGLEFLEVLD